MQRPKLLLGERAFRDVAVGGLELVGDQGQVVRNRAFERDPRLLAVERGAGHMDHDVESHVHEDPVTVETGLDCAHAVVRAVDVRAVRSQAPGAFLGPVELHDCSVVVGVGHVLARGKQVDRALELDLDLVVDLDDLDLAGVGCLAGNVSLDQEVTDDARWGVGVEGDREERLARVRVDAVLSGLLVVSSSLVGLAVVEIRTTPQSQAKGQQCDEKSSLVHRFTPVSAPFPTPALC